MTSRLAAQVVCLLCCRTSELVKVFAEEAYSVALHPTGLSVLVGFADKLRMMVVLMDDLRWGLHCSIQGLECALAWGTGHVSALSASWMHLVVAGALAGMQ